MAERYKDFFEFDPQFKLWLATNNLPSIAGTDDAIWRRIMVIPFPVTIPPRERDKTLVDRLIGELPGILNWAIEGLREWRQEGLNPSPRVLKSTGTYRQENDTVGQWIDAACLQEAGLRASMKELYGSYKSWCENSGVEALQNASLGKELTRRGFDSIKERLGNSRRGIALRIIPGDGTSPMYRDVMDRQSHTASSFIEPVSKVILCANT
jgi:putative DNA primase/helicase